MECGEVFTWTCRTYSGAVRRGRRLLFRAFARSVEFLLFCNCGSRTAVEVLFFVSTKKSTQKKATPGGAKTFVTTPPLGPALPDAASCRGGTVACIPVCDPFGALTQR